MFTLKIMNKKISSLLLNNAIDEVAKLPGIGKKTALRLILHLLRQEDSAVFSLTESLNILKKEIKYCKECHNISDSEICEICTDSSRNKELICVVEDIKDVLAIENTMQFNGVYHVLGGIISPMNGIGPSDLFIDSLISRVDSTKPREVILALSTTMEGDTTNFYIFRKLQNLDVKLSIIARGIAIGDELEYADEVTLGRSIINRTLFSDSLSK